MRHAAYRHAAVGSSARDRRSPSRTTRLVMSTMTSTPNPIRLIAATGIVPVNAGVYLPALAESISLYRCPVHPAQISPVQQLLGLPAPHATLHFPAAAPQQNHSIPIDSQ